MKRWSPGLKTLVFGFAVEPQRRRTREYEHPFVEVLIVPETGRARLPCETMRSIFTPCASASVEKRSARGSTPERSNRFRGPARGYSRF